LTKKLAPNNEIFENMNSNLEGLSFSFKNQLSLNKMFETQLAQIAASILAYDFEKILGQPKISFGKISMNHERW
jgi:conjugal transfer/entry exclusion protein